MSRTTSRPIELLAPAADKEVAKEAILHGADAVYIGGPSHGARSKAANSVEDIAEVVRFAHIYRARVYVTLNTLIYEDEIQEVESLIRSLYKAGVDALIIQDMGILRMNIPPIAVHASTQCDTRTPEKAKFLEDAGFSQIVLARELSIAEIKKISESVCVPLECFVHGALCVSYSGRCGASQIELGRSANRGECAQMCRMSYNLINGRGEVVETNKHLLSLKDLNASSSLEQLMEAGISSFKIEGRMKDASYVKNITASYRKAIDSIIEKYPEKYRRSSYGASEIDFEPRLDKSFNRGFTDYFLPGRRNVKMASLSTPKSMGEIITDVTSLNNGDGISFFNSRGEYEGVLVNGVANGHIIGSRKFSIPNGSPIHRTFDKEWQKKMNRPTAVRTLKVNISIDETGITAVDERGMMGRIELDADRSKALKPFDPKPVFAKLGGTPYRLNRFVNNLSPETFIPASQLTSLRRKLIETLDRANLSSYRYDYRKGEKNCKYPSASLDSRDNVANSLAEKFYRSHGVKDIAPAYEISSPKGNVPVMTTRYCLRRELGCCLKDKSVRPDVRNKYVGPLYVTTGSHRFALEFNCDRCEMNVIRKDSNPSKNRGHR